MKRKANISIELQASNVTNGMDLPDSDWGDFSCRRAVDSSSLYLNCIYQTVARWANYCICSLCYIPMIPVQCKSKRKWQQRFHPLYQLRQTHGASMSLQGMSCQLLGKHLDNNSWRVYPKISFCREGHSKIQVKDPFLVQMMSQCRVTSRKSCPWSQHIVIPIVAGDKSRANCCLSHLTEHKKKNVCND